MLEALERANLFVVALDDERGWYRYHHLFAEVLRRHLQQAEPTLIPELASACQRLVRAARAACRSGAARAGHSRCRARCPLDRTDCAPRCIPGSDLHGARVDERPSRGTGTRTSFPVCVLRIIAHVHQSV